MKMMHCACLFALALAACGQEPQTAAQAESTPPALEAVALPQSDGAGNRLEALTQNGARWCSGDGAWCLEAVDDAPARLTAGDRTIAVPSPGEPWPFIIRVGADRAIVGLVDEEEQMYSGGGGSASGVVLFEVSNGVAQRLAALPLSGSIMTRACFMEEDEQKRAGACHDQYEFASRVRLDETVTGGEPRIVLETAAGTFPGRVTRGEDSGERGQLTEADLVWWHDDACSYRRTFSRSPAGPYLPDAELPACSDYLEP
jgi:hypothetical protein